MHAQLDDEPTLSAVVLVVGVVYLWMRESVQSTDEWEASHRAVHITNGNTLTLGGENLMNNITHN